MWNFTDFFYTKRMHAYVYSIQLPFVPVTMTAIEGAMHNWSIIEEYEGKIVEYTSINSWATVGVKWKLNMPDIFNPLSMIFFSTPPEAFAKINSKMCKII